MEFQYTSKTMPIQNTNHVEERKKNKHFNQLG